MGPEAQASCPRCGGTFACEADTALAAPCPCFGVYLSDSVRTLLRERYTRCLCVPCLRALQAEAGPVNPPPAPR